MVVAPSPFFPDGIDDVVDVPASLYKDLLRLGEAARHGQHVMVTNHQGQPVLRQFSALTEGRRPRRFAVTALDQGGVDCAASAAMTVPEKHTADISETLRDGGRTLLEGSRSWPDECTMVRRPPQPTEKVPDTDLTTLAAKAGLEAEDTDAPWLEAAPVLEEAPLVSGIAFSPPRFFWNLRPLLSSSWPATQERGSPPAAAGEEGRSPVHGALAPKLLAARLEELKEGVRARRRVMFQLPQEA